MRKHFTALLALAIGFACFTEEVAALDLKEFGRRFLQDVERGVDTLERAVRGQEDSGPAAQPAPPEAAPPAISQAPPEPAGADPRRDRALVRELQERLNALRYDAGPVDGLFGSRTAGAIRAYQRDAGRPIDGEPSHALLDELRTGSAVAAPQPPAEGAPAPAPAVSAGAEDFAERLLAPDGLRPGMPVAEAKAALERLGYVRGRAGGCRFERAQAGQGRTEIVLEIARFDPGAAPGPQDVLQRHRQERELARACADDGTVVTGLTYKQMVDRAARSVAPLPEIERLVERLGPYGSCTSLQPAEARWCVWPAPGRDPKIKSLRVTIARGWGREAQLEGDLLEIQPVLPERAQLAEVMTQEALAICQNYGAGLGGSADRFRTFYDCRCIADKVGRAYARGQIAKVDVHAVNRYREGCPAGREQLRAYFEEHCLKTFGSPANVEGKAWALDGGCSCAGERGAEMYLADPRASHPALGRIGSQSALTCGFRAGGASRTAEGPAPAPGPVEAAGAGYATLGSAPAGIRPLEIWLADGRPVVHERFEPWTALDRTFDHRPQELAVARFVDLLMLDAEPSLLDSAADAARLLAGENLADAERARLMKGCQPGQPPRHCAWAGRDEFETRAAEQEFRGRFVPLLTDLAAGLPRELVYVDKAQLGEYDPARGGFPLSIAGTRMSGGGYGGRLFPIAANSLLGYPISGVREQPEPDPDFWSVDAASAPAILERLPSNRSGDRTFRFVKLAWTYRVERFERPQDEPYRRLLVVKATGLRLFADARLTELLAELPLPGAAPAAVAIGETAGAPAAAPAEPSDPAAAPLPVKPLEIPTVDGRAVIELERTTVSVTNVRYLNLLLLGQQPELADDPANALILAGDHLVGLTVPERRAWAGSNEFEQARAEAAFKERGADQVVALAPGLPQEVLIKRRTELDPYDFDREVFPIREGLLLEFGGRRAPDGGMLQRWTRDSIVPKAILLRWRNGVVPDHWQVPLAEAQAVVADLRAGSTGRRPVYLAATARLHRISSDGQGNPVFEADLLEVGLYADRDLTRPLAALPLELAPDG